MSKERVSKKLQSRITVSNESDCFLEALREAFCLPFSVSYPAIQKVSIHPSSSLKSDVPRSPVASRRMREVGILSTLAEANPPHPRPLFCCTEVVLLLLGVGSATQTHQNRPPAHCSSIFQVWGTRKTDLPTRGPKNRSPSGWFGATLVLPW